VWGLFFFFGVFFLFVCTFPFTRVFPLGRPGMSWPRKLLGLPFFVFYWTLFLCLFLLLSKPCNIPLSVLTPGLQVLTSLFFLNPNLSGFLAPKKISSRVLRVLWMVHAPVPERFTSVPPFTWKSSVLASLLFLFSHLSVWFPSIIVGAMVLASRLFEAWDRLIGLLFAFKIGSLLLVPVSIRNGPG